MSASKNLQELCCLDHGFGCRLYMLVTGVCLFFIPAAVYLGVQEDSPGGETPEEQEEIYGNAEISLFVMLVSLLSFLAILIYAATRLEAAGESLLSSEASQAPAAQPQGETSAIFNGYDILSDLFGVPQDAASQDEEAQSPPLSPSSGRPTLES